MSAQQWREAHGYDWYVTSSDDLAFDEVGMGLSIAYGRLNIHPRDRGVADVLCMCVATEIARPVEVSPGVFEEPQVYTELLGSRMELQIHGRRAVVLGAWERLVRCFAEPESMLPVSASAETRTFWVADAAYRTGVNVEWLTALGSGITYEAEEFFERACDLAREIAPSAGRWPCVFVTSDESLVGTGFTEEPEPFSVETLMRDAEQLTRVHDQPGSLWRMGNTFALSTSLPLSAASVAAFHVLVRYMVSVANEVLSEHVSPSVSLYPVGTQLVLNFGLPQLQSLPQIQEFLHRILLKPARCDDGVGQAVFAAVEDDEVRLLLRLRRAPEDIPHPEVIPDLCRQALERAHIPAEVLSPQLRERFPLLAGHESVVNTFPMFTTEPPEGIEPVSGADEVFASRVPFESAQYSNYVPHLISRLGDRLVAEWFIAGQPARGVARRSEVDLSQVIALYDMEGALMLVESDGSTLVLVPEALVNGVALETELRERVRDAALIPSQDQGGVAQVRQIMRLSHKEDALPRVRGNNVGVSSVEGAGKKRSWARVLWSILWLLVVLWGARFCSGMWAHSAPEEGVTVTPVPVPSVVVPSLSSLPQISPASSDEESPASGGSGQ